MSVTQALLVSQNADYVFFSALLLLSVPDFGSPHLVNTAIVVERPIAGLLKLATSVEYGEPDEADENETHEQRRYGKSKPRVITEDEV